MLIGWNKGVFMKIAIAQINTTVGDFEGNYKKIIGSINKARQLGVELLVFPELTITSYPPKDLLTKRSFINRNKDYLKRVINSCKNISIIVGFVDEYKGDIYNAAALIKNSKVIGICHKIHLPNYDVFDEKRYFKEGKEPKVFDLDGLKIGINICEDIWIEQGPVKRQKELGANIIINISASPFHVGKYKLRELIISNQAKRNKVPVAYCNLVGGQDDLIFDGRSYFFNDNGDLLAKAKSFEEDFLVLPEPKDYKKIHCEEDINQEILNALVLGIRDYFSKNNFKKAVIGLSGGIDSALTAVLAVKSLGKENVLGVTMPSKFSSKGSINDSEELAKKIGIEFDIIPIKEIFDVYVKTLSKRFEGAKFNVTEENIQARIRGNILMALSNKFGYLVLATGNKSELSVGYATLYGDMSGGLAVISDLFKTKVYELCRYINNKGGKRIIPNAIMTKEPSAELRENQKDSDSLPVYDVLDPILTAYIEEGQSKEDIIKAGFDKETVEKVINMVDRNEYKRQQAALGLRITPKAFGSGRRMPITNKWVQH